MKKSIELRAILGEKVAEFRSLKDTVTAENKAEVETRSAEMKSEISAIEADIADYEQIEKIEAEAETRSRELRSRAAASRGVETEASNDNGADEFRSYVRGDISEQEYRSLTASGNPGMIPTSVLPTIVEQLTATGAIFGYLTLRPTDNGAPINVNYRTSPSGEGSYINENDYRGDAADMGLAQKTLGALPITSNVVGISNTLIRDTGTNVLDVLKRDVVQVCANKLEREVLLGDGQTGHAEGLFTFANVAVVTASNSAITYDELVDMQTSVDSAYDQTSVWIMNKKTLGLIRKIKDDNKMPVLSNPLVAGAPYILLGSPVVLSNKAPDMAANAIVLGYGDPAAAGEGRIVKNSVSLKRYDDSAFARYNKTGFQADLDFDFKFVNTSAFKTLKSKA